MNKYQKHNLYGGDIVVETVPNLIDISNLRQVPDNQEVFMYPDSDVSIIVEILQMVELQQPEDAIKFHFDSLAHDNDAKSSIIDEITTPVSSRHEHTPPPILLQGVQLIQKSNRPALDTVRIYMGLFRVNEKNVDLVVTFNVPIESQDGNAVDLTNQERVKADFKTFAESLVIINSDLFI